MKIAWLFAILLLAGCATSRTSKIIPVKEVIDKTKKILVTSITQLSPRHSEMVYDNTISKSRIMTEYAPRIEWQLKNWLIDLHDSSTFSRLTAQGYGYLMEIQLSGSRLDENFAYLTNLELKQGETDNRVTQPMDLQKRVVISATLYSLQSRSIIYRNITTTKKNPFGIHDKQGGVYLLNSGSEQRLYHSAIKSALKKMSKDFKLEE